MTPATTKHASRGIALLHVLVKNDQVKRGLWSRAALFRRVFSCSHARRRHRHRRRVLRRCLSRCLCDGGEGFLAVGRLRHVAPTPERGFERAHQQAPHHGHVVRHQHAPPQGQRQQARQRRGRCKRRGERSVPHQIRPRGSPTTAFFFSFKGPAAAAGERRVDDHGHDGFALSTRRGAHCPPRKVARAAQEGKGLCDGRFRGRVVQNDQVHGAGDARDGALVVRARDHRAPPVSHARQQLHDLFASFHLVGNHQGAVRATDFVGGKQRSGDGSLSMAVVVFSQHTCTPSSSSSSLASFWRGLVIHRRRR
mmetsp:Transcript_45830/g.92490  ORF Transcript_45830/g.92490 Transcript_45830/m.92490 type:complete len:309 (+) Transcript_45830:422-1348(+)